MQQNLKTAKTIQTSFRKRLSFFRVNLVMYTTLISLLLVGGILFFIGDKFGSPIVRDLGILLLTIFTMSFIYELVLRNHFQNEMKLLIKETIEESQPVSLQNILQTGIADAYDGIAHDQINDYIKSSLNTEIRACNIYIPQLLTRFDLHLYINAIQNQGCSLKILVCDATCENAIKKRALSANTSRNTYIAGMESNMIALTQLWTELSLPIWQKRLSIRLHQNFISSSLWGFENFYIIGFYHYNISAVKSINLKVNKTAIGIEGNTQYFQQIDASFTEQWNRANKEVVFGKVDGMVWDDANHCNIIGLQGYD